MLDRNINNRPELQELEGSPTQAQREVTIHPDNPVLEALRIRRKLLKNLALVTPDNHKQVTLISLWFQDIIQTLLPHELANESVFLGLREVIINELEYGVDLDQTRLKITVTFDKQTIVATLERDISSTKAENLQSRLEQMEQIDIRDRYTTNETTGVREGSGMAVLAEPLIPTEGSTTAWWINYENTDAGGLKTTVIIKLNSPTKWTPTIPETEDWNNEYWELEGNIASLAGLLSKSKIIKDENGELLPLEERVRITDELINNTDQSTLSDYIKNLISEYIEDRKKAFGY